MLLEGPTGIGKSEIVRAATERLGIGLAVLDLSLLEPPDLVGLPIIEQGRTRYALPSILPQDGAGILLLEELNRAERYIQQPALQLLTARTLHEYRLPEGWVCFAAVNPQDGDYQVTALDPALRARFLQLRVRADRPSWLSWALLAGVHPAVIAVAQAHDRVLDDVSPRTWVYVSQLLRALRPEDSRNTVMLRDALAGYLPPAWLELLLARREIGEVGLTIDVRALLATYAAGSPEAARIGRLRSEGRSDVLDELTHRLLAILSGPEAGVLALSGKLRLEALEALFADLPGDQRDKLQGAIATNPTLLTLAEVKPPELLQNFVGSRADQIISALLTEPLRQHRLGLIVTSLRAYLSDPGRLPELRKSTPARFALGHLLARLASVADSPWAMALVETLQRVGITPVRPA
ncbi:MAG TPA: AAA family ATPase [Pseudomonadota bacterium]|nr:AAA family ATPase [Pseudomonadota bacterium]